MGYRSYYVTAIIALDDKYDIESCDHFSSFSEVRDEDANPCNIIYDAIGLNCETICVITPIGGDSTQLSFERVIRALYSHLIHLRQHFISCKKSLLSKEE